MAATGTPTPNIGLRIPVGTDPASVDDINYNSNLLDTKLGPVGSDSVQDQIDTLNSKFENLMYNLGGIASGASATFQNLYDGTFVILHNASRNAVILLESNNVAVLVQNNMGNNSYSRSGTSITITNGSDRYVYVDVVAH